MWREPKVFLPVPAHIRFTGFFTEAYGGALVSIIHSYTNNGDPFVRKFTDQLLEEVRRKIMSNRIVSPHKHEPGLKTFFHDPPEVDFLRRVI